MLYINSKDRDSIEQFRTVMYNYMKENRLKYSDQRERILKVLYAQHYPVSVNFLVKKLNDETLGAGYATVIRQLKFFEKLNILIIVPKSPKGYLLKAEADTGSMEVINLNISYRDDN